MMRRSQLSDLESRLLATEEPEFGTAWFELDKFSYVRDSDVSKVDVAELISLVRLWADHDQLDARVREFNDESLYDLPIHACRALGELRAVQAIDPLLQTLESVDDDWGWEDIPRAISLIGESAVPALIEFVRDEGNSLSGRGGIIECLTNISNSATQPCCDDVQSQIGQFLIEQLRIVAEDTPPLTSFCETDDYDEVVFNSQLLCGLVELNVTEAAPLIEKAFSKNQFDCGMLGNWSKVREILGVEELGLSMPKHPIDCVAGARRRMGFGIFSDKGVFGDGEPNWDAVEEYIENAVNEFCASTQGKQVVEKNRAIGWIRPFLEMGVNYLGVTVDSMTASDVDEIVFSIFPRKVSVDADTSEEIVFELSRLWEFIDRKYGLKNAGQILDLLSHQAIDRLKGELSDANNFGFAKSMFMEGRSSGFDMTTQEGMSEFMLAYNDNLARSRMDSDHSADSGAAISPRAMTAKERKAFNKKRKKLLSQFTKKRGK